LNDKQTCTICLESRATDEKSAIYCWEITFSAARCSYQKVRSQPCSCSGV